MKKKYQRPLKPLYRVAKDIKLELELGQNLGIIFFGKWIYAMHKCRRPKDISIAKGSGRRGTHQRGEQRSKGSGTVENWGRIEWYHLCRMFFSPQWV